MTESVGRYEPKEKLRVKSRGIEEGIFSLIENELNIPAQIS